MKNETHGPVMTPGLADKLRELKSTLSADDAAAFSSMLDLAVAQANELKAQRASELVGGAGKPELYGKPPQGVTTLTELEMLADLKI